MLRARPANYLGGLGLRLLECRSRGPSRPHETKVPPQKAASPQRVMKLDFIGPDLSLGPLPAIFYFALSAKESLFQDPFNQPVAVWQTYPVRIFSLTLPEHEGHLEPNQAVLAFWKEEMARGRNPISFLKKTGNSSVQEAGSRAC